RTKTGRRNFHLQAATTVKFTGVLLIFRFLLL
ncbi:MAG: hypothetical protein ACI8PT_004996, partial [Gammaproteobacteria bacterium]